MKFLTDRKKSFGATAATVALVGTLSTGLIAIDAQPAEAFVWFGAPLLVSGAAVSSVTAVTGSLIAVAGGLTVAGLGIGGYMLWQDSMKSIPLDAEKDANLAVRESAPGGSATPDAVDVEVDGWNGGATPSAGDVRRGWEYHDIRRGTGADQHKLFFNMTQRATRGSDGTSFVRGMVKYDLECQNIATGAIRFEQGLFKQVGLGSAYGYVAMNNWIGCNAVSETQEVPRWASLRAPTYAEIQTAATSSWSQYFGPTVDQTWRGEGYQPHPDSYYKVDVSCKKPSGEVVTITATSPAGEGHLNIPSCLEYGMQPGPGGIVTSFLDPGKRDQPIWTIKPAPSADQYLNCDPALGQICKLEVYIDGQPCTAGAVMCIDWTRQLRVDPSRIECRYGGHVVDITFCYPLENLYMENPTAADQALTQPNTDGNPDTKQDPRKIPWPMTPTNPGPDPYPHSPEDPVQPEPAEPSPTPSPSPSPSTSPSTSPSNSPSASPSAEPSTPTEPFPPTGPNPADPSGQNCMPGQWSWNPVDFIMIPVACALQWAFIPKKNYTGTIEGLRDAASSKPPLSWAPVFTGPGGGGCPNWVFHVPGVMSKNVVCDSSYTAAIVGARYPLLGLLTAAMIWPLFRSLWYASIPILRVQPSSK